MVILCHLGDFRIHKYIEKLSENEPGEYADRISDPLFYPEPGNKLEVMLYSL